MIGAVAIGHRTGPNDAYRLICDGVNVGVKPVFRVKIDLNQVFEKIEIIEYP